MVRCRANPPTDARLARADTPAWAFFMAVHAHLRRAVCLRLTQMSFLKYNQKVVKAQVLPVLACIRLTLNLI